MENLNTQEFKELLNSEQIILVDFWAKWCGPCKMIAPILEEISNERKDIKIVKIDVDENKELALEYKIRSIPTLMLIKNKEIIAVKNGSINKGNLNAWISNNI